MATYAQIAQQTFNWSREDGSNQAIRLTFEEKDGAAQSLEIPLESSVLITNGDEGDAPNKPIKVSVAEFRLKQTSSTLVEKIRAAQLRDLRLTVENTTSGEELFKGYVVKALTKKILYKGIDQVRVRAIGSMVDLQSATVLSGQRDIDELAGDIGAAIDLDRPLDVYTSLHHDGLSAADPFPLNYQFNQGAAAGPDDAQNLHSALRSMLTSLGFQAFQLNGRLVFADIYERYANSGAINKHEDQGGGVYNNESENLELALDSSHITEDNQEAQQLIEVPDYNHNYGLVTRDAVSYTDPAPQSVGIGEEATSSPDAGLVAGGEVITISYSGQLKSSGNGTPTSGNYDRLQVVLTDQISGAVKYYNPVSDEWQDSEVGWDDSFSFSNGTVQEDTWSESNRALSAVPDGFLATIEVRLILEVSFTSGGSSELGNNELDSFTLSVTGDGVSEVTHTFRSSASDPVGKALSSVFYIGDKDQFSTQQTFEYDNGSNFVDTELWVSPLGNGTLGDVVSARVGTVVLGSAEKFRLRFRDTGRSASLLSVIKLTDEDSNIRTLLPLQITHDLMNGFYEVVAREVTDGFSSQTDLYSTGVTGSGSSGGGGGGGGGGASQLNDLTDVSNDAPATRDVLIYNGTVYENRGLAEADLPGLSAGKITSGQFADGRISESNVTQHQSAIQITEGQITDLDHYTNADLEAHLVGAGSFQQLGTGDDVRFNDLEVTGTINYVNEENLQVEDKTITVNKGGTDGSSVGAGIIVERPSGDKTLLWQSDGWEFEDDIKIVTDSAFNIRLDRTANAGVDHVYSVGVSNSDGILLYNFTDSQSIAFFRHDSIQFNQDLTANGATFSGNVDIENGTLTIRRDGDLGSNFNTLDSFYRAGGTGTNYASLVAQLHVDSGSGNNNRYSLLRHVLQSDYTLDSTYEVAGFDAVGDNHFDGSKRGTWLFTTHGNLYIQTGLTEPTDRYGQPYDTASSNLITFSGGGVALGGGTSGGIQISSNPQLLIRENGGVFQIIQAGTGFGDAKIQIGRDGTVTDFPGKVTIATAQIQTLRTTLFKPNTIIGMGGKSIWNSTSQVASIDTGTNTIVAEDAVFANGDKMIVSSPAYNQSGFSNVELNITSNGSAVSGGTQYSYTVNSGSASDIGNGDTIVKVDGDLIFVDAEDGTDKPSIAGYSDLSGFADSPASGGSADPSWLLTPTKFFYEGISTILYAPEIVADSSDDDSVSTLQISDWTSTVTSPSGPTQTSGSNNIKIVRVVEHKYGLESLVVKGKCRVRNPSGGGGTTDALVTVQYGAASSGSVQVVNSSQSSSSYVDFEIEIDISGETAGDLVEFRVRLQARVQGANSSTVRYADMDGELTAVATAKQAA